MSTSAANEEKSNKENMIVKKDMKDYSNEPYFVNKAEKAAVFLKKHGLPKSFEKKSDLLKS